MEKYKFAISYSMGKDCTLAIQRMINQGHELASLVIGVHTNSKLSFMHAVRFELIEQYEKALGVPVVFMEAAEKYDTNAALDACKKAKELGANAICTGDIDFEYSRAWNEKCAKALDMKAFYPIWHADKEELLNELLDNGYKCIIKAVQSRFDMADVLGKPLDRDIIERFSEKGADICGENGEYHTMVIDGPIFKTPIEYILGNKRQSKVYDIIDILAPVR